MGDITGPRVQRDLWEQAVQLYWTGLERQAANQGRATGIKDYGNRAAVTGGKQMNGLQAAVAAIWKTDPDLRFEIRTAGATSLPAYFRASKNWDLLVLHRGSLVGTMEFKSQRGPSFGNNFNNRTEEALGLAADSQMAAERGLFGHLKPWFGFVMLVERAPDSIRPIGVPKNMPFPADEVFEGASYIDRYRIFFERMVAEGNYDAAALITAAVGSTAYQEPSAALSLVNLEAAIRARMAYIKALPDDLFDQLTLPASQS